MTTLERTSLIMLHGEHVYLRPIRQEDLATLTARANDSAYLTEFNFFGLRQDNLLQQRFLEDGLLGRAQGTLVVVTCEQDLVVGEVSYRLVRYGPGEASTAYNIGIVVAPEQRGNGYGV